MFKIPPYDNIQIYLMTTFTFVDILFNPAEAEVTQTKTQDNCQA